MTPSPLRPTRRSAIGSLLAAPLISALPSVCWGNLGPDKHCVIIGAGLSGLSAALKLQQADWSVTILEARPRTGGRVFSYSFPQQKNLVCELGGEWIGASHERIQALCRQFEIPLQPHQFEDWLCLDGQIKRPGQWGFTDSANTAFDTAKKSYFQLDAEQQRELDQVDWWNYLEKLGYTDADLRLRDLMDSTDFGESIRHVSAFGALAEYAESSPHNEMDFKIVGGNSRLPDELARRVGHDHIYTGHKVTQISQRQGIVSVVTDQQTFQADAVICTVPTHSLSRIEFDPPLPRNQQNAAQQLSYARISKNSVLCEQRFWGPENFSMISDATSHYYFHSTQRQAGPQGILTSYAIGEKADVIASQSESRRLNMISHDLTDFCADAPRQMRAIASYAWQRDEYTDGAYALYRPGQWFGIRPLLQQPHHKVLFAGEHLADWQGFMEGAINSGEAAAEQLIG